MFKKVIDELKCLSQDFNIEIEECMIYHDMLRSNSNLLIKYDNIIISKWHLTLGLGQSMPQLVLARIAYEKLNQKRVLHFSKLNKKIYHIHRGLCFSQ